MRYYYSCKTGRGIAPFLLCENSSRKVIIMKIAVTSSGRDLESEVDPRFGRASYFILVDSESMAFDVVENSQNFNAPQGAGIQAAQIVADHGADVVISGNCGPKAYKTLSAAGIQVMVSVAGTVKEAVEGYRTGKLAPAQAPNVEGHWI